MVNIVIIDDEWNARSFLSNLLEKELGSEYHLVESCASVKDGAKAIKDNAVDLVFLDIQMPEEDGFELMGYFEEIDFEIIFVTAFDQFAIRAFECSALHYLLKPLDVVEVRKAIARYKKTSDNKKALLQKFDVFEEYIERKQEKKRIIFDTANGFDVVVLKDILYVDAQGNYCDIYLKGGPKKTVMVSMKHMEECLPDMHFCRIHHSSIVNLNEINRFVMVDKEVKLSNGTILKVSERKLKTFKQRIGEMV